jgi:hypothetical protein
MGTFAAVQLSVSGGVSCKGALEALERDPDLLSCCIALAARVVSTGWPGNCFN